MVHHIAILIYDLNLVAAPVLMDIARTFHLSDSSKIPAPLTYTDFATENATTITLEPTVVRAMETETRELPPLKSPLSKQATQSIPM